MKKLFKKVLSNPFINSLALLCIINSVSSTCFWDFYPPKMPDSARDLVK